MLRPVAYNLLSFAIGFVFYLDAGGNSPGFAQSVDNSNVHKIQVPFVADKIRSLPDKSVVLVSTRDGRIQRLTSQSDVPSWDITDVPYWDIPLKHPIADISISKDGDFISFAGILDEKIPSGAATDQKTVISRVKVGTGAISQITLNVGSGQPTITFGERQELYLGVSRSPGITKIDPQVFDEQSVSHLSAITPKAVINNPELVGVSDLTTTQSGRVLFVSSFDPRGVSAYDLSVGKWIDYFPILNSKLAICPLRLSAADPTAEPANSEHATTLASVVVADFGPVSRLVVAELDEAFGAFAIIQSVDLNFFASSPSGTCVDDLTKSPLLLSSDRREQQTIAVGSRLSRDIYIFGRSGRAIELRGSRTLATSPLDISVSPDGSAIAVLMSRDSQGSQVEISHPDSSAYSTTPLSPEQSKLSQAQKALSQLGYPVGSVDGAPGPQTTQAILLFQKRAGLPVTGVLDDPTKAALNIPK
jgi:hypothetical protein